MSAAAAEPAAIAPEHPAPATTRRSLADRAAALFALVALPLGAHAAFSRFGFNPTDDGFILAYARRLLDGQVPHRDFISIRPVGSALLHAPWVLLGGEHTYLLARLAVWFEIALASWCWVRLCVALTGRPARASHAAVLTTVAFVLGANTFAIMPWHTLDAIVLGSAGLLLASSPRPGRKAAGYVLMGAAVLCRQNFLPLAPVAALLLGDRRRAWVGACIVAPLAAYGAWLLAAGALLPAFAQMSAQSGLQETAFAAFFRSPWTLAGMLAGQAAAFAQARAWRANGRFAAAGEGIAWAAAGAAVLAMTLGGAAFADAAGFGLFGFTLGVALSRVLLGSGAAGRSRLAWLALLLAWCTAISIGLNSPALAAGVLAVTSLVLLAPPERPVRAAPRRWPLASAVRVALAAALCAAWAFARLHVIYRERPAAELTWPLGGVLPGGAGLYTNARTHALLVDLERAVAMTGGRPHAIVADFPGYWVRSPERNPLSIDWAQSVELSTPGLQQRVLSDLEALRGRGDVIVQKLEATSIAERSRPLPQSRYYFVPFWVRGHMRRVGETEYFELYR